MGENFNIVQFLKSAVATGASDEHLKVGYPPYIRKNGFIMKSKNLQTTFADVGITERMELIKPQKEIRGKNNAVIVFAKTEYRLNVLK